MGTIAVISPSADIFRSASFPDQWLRRTDSALGPKGAAHPRMGLVG
jgi:hypothetical protein